MRRRTVLALLPVGLVLGSCTQGGGGEDAPSPAEALATARERFDTAGSVAFDLRGASIPKGRNGVSAATGVGIVDAEDPRFRGQVTGVIKGTSAGVEIIAVGERTWMSFFTKEFNPVDMADLGAPNPSAFFAPKTGVSRVLAETRDLATGDKARDGKLIVQKYSGTVPAAVVADLFALGKEADSFAVTYGIDPDTGELRTAALAGEFYPGTPGTATITLSEYGADVDIQPPA